MKKLLKILAIVSVFSTIWLTLVWFNGRHAADHPVIRETEAVELAQQRIRNFCINENYECDGINFEPAYIKRGDGELWLVGYDSARREFAIIVDPRGGTEITSLRKE